MLPDISNYSLQEKYQILSAYLQGGGIDALIESEQPEDESVIEHEGKKYKRIQIEGDTQDYLMDEAGNIFNSNMEFVGEAGGEESEEDDGN